MEDTAGQSEAFPPKETGSRYIFVLVPSFVGWWCEAVHGQHWEQVREACLQCGGREKEEGEKGGKCSESVCGQEGEAFKMCTFSFFAV